MFIAALLLLNFDFLEIKGNRVQVTNGVQLQVTVEPRFRLAGENHRRAKLRGKDLMISRALFVDGSKFVLIHAEVLANKDGSLDYSNLPVESINGHRTNTREMVAPLTEADVREEADLAFLRLKGFRPTPVLRLKQHFLTTSDNNAELVITVGRRYESERAASGDKEFSESVLSAFELGNSVPVIGR